MTSLADLISISLVPVILIQIINPSDNIFNKIIFTNFFHTISLDFIIIIFLLLFILKLILVFIINFNIYSYCYNIQNKIISKIFDNLIYSRKKKDESYFQNLLKITESFIKGLLICLFHFFNEFLSILFICIFLFYWNFYISLYSFIIILFFFLFYQFSFKNMVTKLGKNNVDLTQIFYKYLNYAFNGYREILIYKKSTNFFNYITAKLSNYKKVNIYFDLINLVPRASIELIFILSMVLLFFFLKNDYDILLNSGVYGFAFIKIAPSISKILNLLNSIRHSYYTTKIIRDEMVSKTVHSHNETSLSNNFSYLEAKNLSFCYDENKFFNYIDFKIQRGEKILIKGRSGAGKSTLLDLLAGIQIPTSGKINFYDSNDNIIKYPDIGYCPQFPLILENEINSNIQLKFDGEKTTNTNNIFNIADNLFLADSIKNLSAGELKRVGLSRILYMNNEIMIIDEPLANLDTDSQNIVIENLTKYVDKTIIAVSHNNALDKYFKKIIYVE